MLGITKNFSNHALLIQRLRVVQKPECRNIIMTNTAVRRSAILDLHLLAKCWSKSSDWLVSQFTVIAIQSNEWNTLYWVQDNFVL